MEAPDIHSMCASKISLVASRPLSLFPCFAVCLPWEVETDVQRMSAPKATLSSSFCPRQTLRRPWLATQMHRKYSKRKLSQCNFTHNRDNKVLACGFYTSFLMKSFRNNSFNTYQMLKPKNYIFVSLKCLIVYKPFNSLKMTTFTTH